jgi:predicted nucleic acid-binding Zn ribbon protein
MTNKRPKMRRPAVVSDLLRALLRGTPAEKRIKEGEIWLVWEDAVGSRIASHAQPAAFRDGTLTLTVDSAPWMQQLSFLKHEIVAKVNDQLGEGMVKDLYMKAGKIRSALPAEAPKPPKRRALTDEERDWIAEESAAVSDPDLQEVFASLMKKDREAR